MVDWKVEATSRGGSKANTVILTLAHDGAVAKFECYCGDELAAKLLAERVQLSLPQRLPA